MTCDCWSEDIWKFIYVLARISSFRENEEKAAFCTLILAINSIISCNRIRQEINSYMEQDKNNILAYMDSNENLLMWVINFHNHYNLMFKNNIIISLDNILLEFDPNKLTKDKWGPYVWKGIHFVLLQGRTEHSFCPLDVSIAMKAFITCTGIVLPCKKCRHHAWGYFSEHSIDEWLDTPLHAFQWSVHFHNFVTDHTNKSYQLHRPIFTPEEAILLYKK